MKKRWGSGAAVAAAFLIACGGGEPSVASKSAQAYREAQAKGVNVAGDPSAPSDASTAHDAHAGMNHGNSSSASSTAVDHAAMGHGTAPGAADHSAHAGSAAVDHAAMGHGSASAATDHSAHGAAPGRAPATNHAAMGHGTAAATTDHSAHRAPARAAASSTDHAATGHGSTAAASADHSAHAAGTVESSTHSAHPATPQADPHAAHGGAVPATAVIATPQTNAALGKLKPGATLQPDAFDAPRPAPIAEAAKAREPMDHSGHTRGITAGEDEANPPTPMPATRDGEAFRGTSARPAASHVHSSGAASSATPAAEAMYSCPMHPEVTSDKPGTCPKCGMALVKKK